MFADTYLEESEQSGSSLIFNKKIPAWQDFFHCPLCVIHNIAFLEHIESALQNVIIKIRFRGIKKTTHFQFFLKMNGLSRFFYSVEWWKYYFSFDVFPKPLSNLQIDPM